ncbi:MAG TPA: DUF4149 domain-containing protein [Vicinamibacterales bacterium]|nr:DUF4149 domain-containing protein [Vicinamibacterales bacterium]
MLALRLVYVLALAVWLGGMTILGAVVAPTIFQTMQTADPESGRALAGLAFGEMLVRFHYVAYGCGVLLLTMLVIMALLGPRPKGFAIRCGLVVAMLLVAAYSGLAVLTEIDAIQQEVGSLPSKLPASDPRRIRFDELHQLSTRLMMVNLLGGLVLLYWEAAE